MVDILHRTGIKAPINEVYKALTTRDGLAGWWTRDTQGDGSKVAGALHFGFRNPDGTELGAFDIKVLELKPAERVLWQVVGGPDEWIGTTILWDLKQDGEYVSVMFKHQGWKEPVDFMHHCSTKWAVFLLSLKALLETGQGAPSPDDVKIDSWN